MKLKLIFTVIALIIVASSIWYFDPFHKSVETVDELIGNNYDYAVKTFFHSEPSSSTLFNINDNLNEFQGGVLSKKEIVRDSIIKQYTWTFLNHKTTIWVSKTDKLDNEIIDAIRYKNEVKF
jgi:hypothetical protein